jgi:2'-5' RNA ligase
MRLFVALEISEPVRREVARRLAGVRDRLPGARWVDPANLHLTLLFLGEVASDRIPALTARLQQAFAPYPSLAMRISGAGTFPPGRPARVAWLGLDAPDDLIALQADATRAAVETVQHEPEEREYQPHITLARCPSPWRRDAIEQFTRAFPGEIGPPFVADHGVLMESRLSPRGARYQVIAELPLEGPDADADHPEDMEEETP